MSALKRISLLAEAELRLLEIGLLIEAQAKEYSADWRGSGKTVYREGGKFASKSTNTTISIPEATNKNLDFSDILGKPDQRLNYASGLMSALNPAVAQRYAAADVLSKELPKASTEEALAKRVAYMDYDELKNRKSTNPATQIVQRDLDRRNLEIEGLITDPYSGFKAWKVNSKEGDRPILVATGTETSGLEDIKADLLGEVGNDQYKLNAKKIGDYLEEQAAKGQKVEVTGHSLGGALTQMIVAEHPDKISKASTFNAAGVPDMVEKTYEQNVEKTGQRPDITHHVAEGDFVSLAGDRFLEGNISVSGDYGDPINAHLGMIGNHTERLMPRSELESPDYNASFLGETLTRQQQHENRTAVQPLLYAVLGS